MRIEIPHETERFGGVIIHGVQRVYELDSGPSVSQPDLIERPIIQRLAYEEMNEIEQDTAIVVPVYSERIRLLEGVLCGIPHPCLVIVVSNSPREPVDRFHMEKDAIEHLTKFTQKAVVVTHQKDPVLAQAFANAGYTALLDEHGLIRNGKAEGMILGTMLAKLSGKKYLGFVDADNYFPGAIQEYIQEYSAGFIMSKSAYTLVRIAWQSKPKVMGESLFFAKRGRVSVNTNRVLNRLMSYYTGFGTEIIKTGNAGEHALSMALAMLMGFSSGYSIEPYHYIDLWEKFGGVIPPEHPQVMQQHVEIFQIESRNPHLHAEKGEEHVDDMIYAAQQVIYHSAICPERLKLELRHEMQNRKFMAEGQEPARPNYYPPLAKLDQAVFMKTIENQPCAEFLRR